MPGGKFAPINQKAYSDLGTELDVIGMEFLLSFLRRRVLSIIPGKCSLNGFVLGFDHFHVCALPSGKEKTETRFRGKRRCKADLNRKLFRPFYPFNITPRQLKLARAIQSVNLRLKMKMSTSFAQTLPQKSKVWVYKNG